MTLNIHPAGIRIFGEKEKAKEILDRAVATGLIAETVYEFMVKGKTCYIGFDSDMPATVAERGNAVCHIAAIARETGVDNTRVVFRSHDEWLRSVKLREEDGECKRL